jgi:hypothetical protein
MLVYVQREGSFEPVPVTVISRGREQAAVEGAVRAGDRVALVRPDLAADEAAGGR